MQQISLIKQRILQYIDYKGISKYKFYQDSGITRGVLDKESGITEDNIAKFIAYEPDINFTWLLTGEGEMIKTKSKENVIKKNDDKNDDNFDDKPNVKKMSYNEPEEEKVYPLYSEQEYRAVMRKIKFAEGVSLADEGAPFYPLPVSAGNAMQLLEEEEKPTGFLSIPGVYCKAYFPVIGFSFEPIIRAGDVIGIDFINRWEMLDPDCIYFIITHDQRMIKRLSDDPDNPDRLICISPNHKEFPIYKSEIKAIHKVIFYGRLV